MYNADIAVIGMACKFPKSNNLDEFWRNLCSGKDCITRTDNAESVSTIGAFGAIDNPYDFDNEFFNISNIDAQSIAPQQRLAIKLTYCAMEDAGYDPFNTDGVVGIVCGEAENEYHYERLKYLETNEPELMMAERFNSGASLTSRIAFKFNLKGPCVTIDTACSTSLSAVHIASNMLRSGDADIMLAGGTCVLLNQKGYASFENVMSSDGYTRAYDQNGTGFVPGNGGGMVVLKRLDDAVRDGDHIYAVIKGSAMNNDGSDKIGYTAPAVHGHINVINKAVKNSGINIGQVDYLEGHGTATVLGDAVEIRAFKKVFRDVKEKNILFGSLKSNFGHLNSAAGIASFIKTVLVLNKMEIPPSIHVKQVNAELGSRSCLKVITEYTKLAKREKKYIAGVSSIGIGGSNAHVILEEYQSPVAKEDNRHHALLLLSNSDVNILNRYENNISSFVQTGEVDLRGAEYTLAYRRKHFDKRKFLVYQKEKCIYKSPVYDSKESSSREIVMLFGGTGTYYEGLGQELCKTNSLFKKHYDHCVRIFSALFPQVDLTDESEEELQCVKIAITEYALAKYLIEIGVKPDILVGYSMGEYIAAAIAEVMSIDDVLSIVYRRAKIINQIQNSTMHLVACSPDRLEAVVGDGIYIAGYNAHDRCLVVCKDSELNKFRSFLDENSIFAQALPIKSPAHSKELERVRDQITELFDVEYKPAKYRLASTYHGSIVNEISFSNNEYWIEQMMNPVRFTDAIADLYRVEPGFKYFLHIGADAGLTNYIRRDYSKNCEVVEFLAFEMEERRFLEGIGKLWSIGINFAINKIFEQNECTAVHLPQYLFNEKYFNIIDSNHEGTMTKSNCVVDDKLDNDVQKYTTDYITENIVNIIKSVAGIETVNVDDEVASLGIDSLAVLIIQTKLQATFNCELSIKELYACRKVLDLIELVQLHASDASNESFDEDVDDGIKDLSDLLNLTN